MARTTGQRGLMVSLSIAAAAATLAVGTALAHGGYGPGHGMGCGAGYGPEACGAGAGPGMRQGMGPGDGSGPGRGVAPMTEEERTVHREKMHSLASYDECKAYMAHFGAQMHERAKAQGRTMRGPNPQACDLMKDRGAFKQ